MSLTSNLKRIVEQQKKNSIENICVITTKQLVSIFGNETNKRTYKKNKKITNSTRDKLLKIAMSYCDIKPLGSGRFEILTVYNSPIHIRGILKKERLFLSQFFNNKDLLKSYSYIDLCNLINLTVLSDECDIELQLDALKNFIDFKIEKQISKDITGCDNVSQIIINVFKIHFIILNKNENCFNYISYPDYYDFSGIYNVFNNTEIYIGSTKNLYQRFMDHFKDYQNFNKTYKILQNNGFFEVIELVDITDDSTKFDKNLQSKEYEYIKDYIFNYSIGTEIRKLLNSVIPDKDGNLINLGTSNKKSLKSKKEKYINFKVKQDYINDIVSFMDKNHIEYQIM